MLRFMLCYVTFIWSRKIPCRSSSSTWSEFKTTERIFSVWLVRAHVHVSSQKLTPSDARWRVANSWTGRNDKIRKNCLTIGIIFPGAISNSQLVAGTPISRTNPVSRDDKFETNSRESAGLSPASIIAPPLSCCFSQLSPVMPSWSLAKPPSPAPPL